MASSSRVEILNEGGEMSLLEALALNSAYLPPVTVQA